MLQSHYQGTKLVLCLYYTVPLRFLKEQMVQKPKFFPKVTDCPQSKWDKHMEGVMSLYSTFSCMLPLLQKWAFVPGFVDLESCSSLSLGLEHSCRLLSCAVKSSAGNYFPLQSSRSYLEKSCDKSDTLCCLLLSCAACNTGLNAAPFHPESSWFLCNSKVF